MGCLVVGTIKTAYSDTYTSSDRSYVRPPFPPCEGMARVPGGSKYKYCITGRKRADSHWTKCHRLRPSIAPLIYRRACRGSRRGAQHLGRIRRSGDPG